MNAKSMNVWIAGLAMILGAKIAAAGQAEPSTPDSEGLLGANDNEWIHPAKNYEGNPYSGLTQIAPNNVEIGRAHV